MKKKTQNLKAFVENINGKMLAVASDEMEDRQGDKLNLETWDLRNYKKNPVLQFAHNYNLPPIGLAKNIRVEGKKLLFEPEFHEITQLAREVKQLYEEGIMKAFSVGFLIKEKDGEQSLELLEISGVPVPANPRALVLEKSIEASIPDEEVEKINEWITSEKSEKEIEKKTLKKKTDKTVPAIKKEAESEEKKEEMAEKAEMKAGKVLSRKSRSVIESAISALQELIKVDSAEDEKKEVEEVEDERMEIEEKTFENIKGRDQQLNIKKTVEAINSQVGFLIRKAMKNNK